MGYVIGSGLAVAVCAFGLLSGFDRERVFYPTMLIVIAALYLLFAVMGNSLSALAIESLPASMFIILAVVGFKKNLWLVAAGIAGHGVFDSFHHLVIHNPGVPTWWPGFCASFDIIAGIIFAVLLKRRPRLATT